MALDELLHSVFQSKFLFLEINFFSTFSESERYKREESSCKRLSRDLC